MPPPPSYKLRSGDTGRTISVKVTGSKTGYTPASRTSAGTSPIAKGTLYRTHAHDHRHRGRSGPPSPRSWRLGPGAGDPNL